MKRELVSSHKILITGIHGFTGINLAKKFLALDYLVYGISRRKKSINYKNLSVFQCDILDFEALNKIILDVKPDYVFHFAGNSSNIGDPIEKYRLNIIGTENILRSLNDSNSKIKKVIISSSAAVYGDKNSICNESQTLEPITHYGISKLGVEKISATYFNKLPLIITRPFNYTGIGQNDEFLIPKIISHFKNKKDSIELGNVNVSREFNSLEFVIDCYFKLMFCNSISKIVNICSGKTYSILEIISYIEIIIDHKIKIYSNKKYFRENDAYFLAGDPTLLRSLIKVNYNKNDIKKTLTRMLFDE